MPHNTTRTSDIRVTQHGIDYLGSRLPRYAIKNGQSNFVSTEPRVYSFLDSTVRVGLSVQ